MHSIKSIAPLHRHLCPTFAKPQVLLTTSLLPRRLLQPKLTDSIKVRKTHPQNKRPFTTNPIASMSSFSNADTGSKPADPYKQKNLDNNASLRDKVEDLVAFIDSSKFGMMTTRAQNGLLVSRCMALAAKVSSHKPPNHPMHIVESLCLGQKNTRSQVNRKTIHKLTVASFVRKRTGRRWSGSDLPHQHRIRQDRRPAQGPEHQHVLHQLLRRMGFSLRRSIHHHRPRRRPQILLARAKSVDRRPRRRQARRRPRRPAHRCHQAQRQDGDVCGVGPLRRLAWRTDCQGRRDGRFAERA